MMMVVDQGVCYVPVSVLVPVEFVPTGGMPPVQTTRVESDLSDQEVQMLCKSVGMKNIGPYWIRKQIAEILWMEVRAIRTLIWGELHLQNSPDLGKEEKKTVTIAVRDWVITSLWSAWIGPVEKRLQAAKRQETLSWILERLVFFDSAREVAQPCISRLFGGLRKALKKNVDGEVPQVHPRLEAYVQQFLQMQDYAALKKALLIQSVMRMRGSSTDKGKILHFLCDWSARVLLTRERVKFLSNGFHTVKERLQRKWPKVAVGRVWNQLQPNIGTYQRRLEELTFRHTDKIVIRWGLDWATRLQDAVSGKEMAAFVVTTCVGQEIPWKEHGQVGELAHIPAPHDFPLKIIEVNGEPTSELSGSGEDEEFSEAATSDSGELSTVAPVIVPARKRWADIRDDDDDSEGEEQW